MLHAKSKANCLQQYFIVNTNVRLLTSRHTDIWLSQVQFIKIQVNKL